MNIFPKKKVFTADEQYAMNVKRQMKFDNKMVKALINLMMDLSKTNRTVYLHDDTGAIIMNRRFALKNNLKFSDGVDFYTVIKESELNELRIIKEKYLRIELENQIRKEVHAAAIVQNQIVQKNVPKIEKITENEPEEEKFEQSDMNDGLPDDDQVKNENMQKTEPEIDQKVLASISSVKEEEIDEDNKPPETHKTDESGIVSEEKEEPTFKSRGNKNWAQIRAINKYRSAQRQTLASKYQNTNASDNNVDEENI